MNAVPTPGELSRRGWATAIGSATDRWHDSERITVTVDSLVRPVRAIKYCRVASQTRSMLVNHGGPRGKPNEIWRYFVNPEKAQLVFPVQGGSPASLQQDLANTNDILSDIAVVQGACVGAKATVAGISWGATVSMAYAARFPNAVSALVMSSPLVPTQRSLDHMVSPKGGFSSNRELWEAFVRPLPLSSRNSGRSAFHAYFEMFTGSPQDTELTASFNALIYAIFGDYDQNMPASLIPRDASRNQSALAWAYFAMQARPFFIDIGKVYRGLRQLKAAGVPVFLIQCSEDKTAHPSDVDRICECAGARLIKVEGGHSSANARIQIRSILEELQFC